MGEPQKQLTFGLETLPKVLMFLQSFSERLVGGRARGRRGCRQQHSALGAILPPPLPAGPTPHTSPRGDSSPKPPSAHAPPREVFPWSMQQITVGRGCSSPPLRSTKSCQSLLNLSLIKTLHVLDWLDVALMDAPLLYHHTFPSSAQTQHSPDSEPLKSIQCFKIHEKKINIDDLEATLASSSAALG